MKIKLRGNTKYITFAPSEEDKELLLACSGFGQMYPHRTRWTLRVDRSPDRFGHSSKAEWDYGEGYEGGQPVSREQFFAHACGKAEIELKVEKKLILHDHNAIATGDGGVQFGCLTLSASQIENLEEVLGNGPSGGEIVFRYEGEIITLNDVSETIMWLGGK